jgi:hypothetical protein
MGLQLLIRPKQNQHQQPRSESESPVTEIAIAGIEVSVNASITSCIMLELTAVIQKTVRHLTPEKITKKLNHWSSKSVSKFFLSHSGLLPPL